VIEMVPITSRDNALLMRLRKLARAPGAYRKLGAVWIEGEHLCAALRSRERVAVQALASESAWHSRRCASWRNGRHASPWCPMACSDR
jgi:hypothetical protein